MLKIENLVKRYPTGDLALNGVSLEIGRGEVVALIGPSGAGKSTLIRAINRLVEPTSGRILLNDVNVPSLGASALRRARRTMGMIFQEYALVERLTVMENVLSGQLGYVSFWRSLVRKFPQPVVNEAFRLLERVGLEEFVDKRADALSGGQRQRVGIARALLQNPEILLVDEPTASLDPKTSRQIMRLITELTAERGLGAIINIHDVPLAMLFVKRIIGLREGKIVYDGDPDGLTPKQLTEIYGEEDWTATARGKKGAEDEDAEEEDDKPSLKATSNRARKGKKASKASRTASIKASGTRPKAGARKRAAAK
jgi:phosphonate transport system ATP-binding protein